MTGRIRWEDSGYPDSLLGYVGNHEEWLFQIWTGGDRGQYQLISSMAFGPAGSERPESADLEELKAEAEKRLAEFTASLGATFPPVEDSYTFVGQTRATHIHRYSGQVLRHSHEGGAYQHGYYEHAEDAQR